ncbi:MAG: PQQ-binding-like beta-propeller repeat protein [Actinomycetota bacterium]
MNLLNSLPGAILVSRRLRGAALGAATLCFAVVSAGALPPPPPNTTFSWVQALSGSQSFGFMNEEAQSVVFDSEGHVVTAGRTIGLLNGGSERSFTVARWSPTGEREWVRTLPPSLNSYDVAWAVKTDADDNVIAAGRSAAADNESQFTVARWDRNGNLQWRNTLDLGEFLGSTAFDLAPAPGGDVIAVGIADRSPDPGELVVVRLGALAGEVKWTKRIAGEGSAAWARAVAVDREGDVLVGGRAPGSDGMPGAAVLKLDGATGDLLWSQELSTGRSDLDSVRSLRLNRRGDVIAGGAIQGRFTVVRLNAETGRLRWSRMIQGPAGPGVGEALSVALDADGHAVAGGYSSDSVFTVAKLHGETGAPLWTRMILGPAPDYRLIPARANAVAVDPAGRIIAAGYRIDSSIPDASLMVQRWDASGRPLASRYLDGDIRATEGEAGLAVAVSRTGDIAVAGSIVNSQTGVDFTVAYAANEAAPRLRASRHRVAFAPTRVGKMRQAKLVLTNRGYTVWNGTIEIPAGGFTVGVEGEPPLPGGASEQSLTIEPGQRLRLEIGFAPTEPGRHSGKLGFRFEGAPFRQLEIGVSGVGRAASR